MRSGIASHRNNAVALCSAKFECSAWLGRSKLGGVNLQAFYKWIQDDFGADAVVHVGMHGTVEWCVFLRDAAPSLSVSMGTA